METCAMSRRTWIGSIPLHRLTLPARTRKRVRCPQGKLRLCPPMEVEQLEERLTPSVLSVFELDGNVITGVQGNSGSTSPSHDWDQVFDNVPIDALVAGFVTDTANSRDDSIFTGGGSKD